MAKNLVVKFQDIPESQFNQPAVLKGGPGSGDRGHAGRPGEVGGSGEGERDHNPHGGPEGKAAHEHVGRALGLIGNDENFNDLYAREGVDVAPNNSYNYDEKNGKHNISIDFNTEESGHSLDDTYKAIRKAGYKRTDSEPDPLQMPGPYKHFQQAKTGNTLVVSRNGEPWSRSYSVTGHIKGPAPTE